MPKFSYQAYNNLKERKEGVIEAENKTQALAKLDSLALFPIRITTQEESASSSFTTSATKARSQDIINFTRQIANLLDAGLTILVALNILSKQKWSPTFKLVIEKLIDSVREGKSFSDSLNQYPKIFSSLYVSMVRSGEMGGFLKEIIKRLADFMENEDELKNKVSSAMVYPLLILSVGILTVFILLSFVVPKLVLVFEDFGQALPMPTQILISISSFLNQFWWTIILLFGIVVFVINRVLKTKEGKLLFDGLTLKIPLLGELVLKRQVERFSRILSTLLHSGVTILPSLEVARDILDNSILKKEVESVRVDVRDGSSLAKAVSRAKTFPASLVTIISVGEESGNLEDVLLKFSIGYERDIDRAVKMVTSLLEPLMILTMGAVVAFIVSAMLLPIFQINFIAR